VGFATDSIQQPWAMFSTGSDGGGSLYARTSYGGGTLTDIDSLPIPGDVTVAHNYRIDWTATGFDYFIDGAPVASHVVPLTEAMRAMHAQASDFTADLAGVSVDSMILNTHKETGTFTSQKFDAGDPRVTELSFKATGPPPPTGTTSEYETRTATSAAGLDSTPWQPVTDGKITSLVKQHLQYRVTMKTTVATATPRLDKVEIGFTVDNQAPVVTIDDVAVSGATAKMTFHSDDAMAVNKCKLDSAAFASCASPAEFGVAVGSHTIVVQSTDVVGNQGFATRTFDVAPTTPPPSGGGTTPPPSGTPLDLTAPKVLITQRSVRVSKRGIARIRVTCPVTEVRCTVAVKLKLKGKTVARKTLTVRGGTTRTLDLRLSKSARSTLAARSRVKVTAVVTATDAAANHKTTRLRMTLRAPSH
jgi:hypothetical protein